MSGCAAHYALTIAAPFDTRAIGACVPTFPARMSQKISARTFGTLAVGTSIGFIAVSPCVAADQPSCWYSTGAYISDTMTIEPYSLSPGIISIPQTTLVNNGNLFTDGGAVTPSTLTARVVSVGLRIRYSGTELNRGGTIYGLVTPDHGNINGAGVSFMGSFKECIKVPVGRQWTELVVSAVDPDETVYPDGSTLISLGSAGSGAAEAIRMLYPYSQGASITASAVAVGAPVAAFIVTGHPGNHFEFELITHLELIGRSVQAVSTKSHSDVQGMSDVTQAAGSAASMRGSSGMSQFAAFAKSIAEVAYENRREIVAGAQLAANLFAPSAVRRVRGG